MTSILFFVIAISLLVGVHEWGHFIVAKRVGVKVLRFSIGFGPKLFSRSSSETEFCVCLIPLGGYVRMLDEKTDKVRKKERERAFNQQSLGARTAVVLAGPAMNFIFAIIAYFFMMLIGFATPKAIVGSVGVGSMADIAGLKKGHEITSVNGVSAITWEDVMRRTLNSAMTQESVIWQVQSNDDVTKLVTLDIPLTLIDKIADSDFLSVLGIGPFTNSLEPLIDKVFADGAAARSGLQSGDLVMIVDGETVSSWEQWVSLIQSSYDRTLEVDVLREGAIKRLLLAPDKVERDGSIIGRIGATTLIPDGFERVPNVLVRPGVFDSAAAALDKTWSMSVLTLKFIKKMITGGLSTKNLSGPISIAKYAGQSADLGLSRYLEFLALISVSLGVLNLLPIPMLDGGHLLNYLLEFMTGRPVPETLEAIGLRVGFVILMGLMGTALYNDLTGLI
ncbi:MAG: RIP metalloprotease RseP [Gammaproteobacteria bacterium]